MMKSSFYAKIVVVICVLALFGCGSKETRSKWMQVTRINIEAEPRSLDPRKARTLGEMNLARAFYEGLFRRNQGGEISFGVAKSHLLSEEKTKYTFILRESKWSNGDPLTAHDFVYTWKKTLSPDFASDYAFLLYPIKNAKAVKEGILPSNMLGLRAENDFTLVVELEQPTPYFLELVSLPIYFPINARIDKENAGWARDCKSYISNGPFSMQEWQHNDHIVAVKNPRYWDSSAVQMDCISMFMVDAETGLLMFENGELDWQGSPCSIIPVAAIDSLKEQNKIRFRSFLGTFWIRTNTALFPLYSEDFRKALAFAIDRSEIVEHVTCGNQMPATGIVPLSMGLQSTPHFVDGARDLAKELFEKAVEKEKINLEHFPNITLTYPATSRNHKLAQAIQDQWRAVLGIFVKLEPLESKVFYDRVSKKDFQLALGDWIADFSDPISFLEIFKTRSIGGNNTNWESLDYQKALEASYLAVTESERMDALKRAETILINEMPVIPIYHHTMVYLQNEKLKGVMLNESGSMDFKWAYIEK